VAEKENFLPPLRDVIQRHDLGAKRSLGQHFLLDGNLCGRIARLGGDLDGVSVIEIGPGPGGLTRALLDQGAAYVVAIEKDERCVQALGELGDVYPGRLKILEGDALQVDAATLGAAPRRIIANLPYNISTALLIHWLPRISSFAGLHLMFQKEVAGRICAGPGTKAYGRLSIITQWLCETHLEFDVDRRAFTPSPRVTSSVVSFTPRTQPLAEADFSAMERVTSIAFGQRRKMVRSSLKLLADSFPEIGIESTRRAEELCIEEYCALARALSRFEKA